MGKLGMAVGFAAGYVLGARAGKERYQQINEAATRLRERPEVKRVTEQASEKVSAATQRATTAASAKVEQVRNQAADKLGKGKEPGDTGGRRRPGRQVPVVAEARPVVADASPVLPPEPTVVASQDAAPTPLEPTTPLPGEAIPPAEPAKRRRP